VTRRGKNHSDYTLLSKYFDHIKYNSPNFFLFENVPLIANDESFRKHIKNLERDGYSVLGKTIVYSDYGAPTRRHRFILFGTRIGTANKFFDRLSEYVRSPRTVKDVIWALRNKKKGEVQDHTWPELRTMHACGRVAEFPQISVAVDFQRHCQSADGARNHCDPRYDDLYSHIVRVRSQGTLQANSENCVATTIRFLLFWSVVACMQSSTYVFG